MVIEIRNADHHQLIKSVNGNCSVFNTDNLFNVSLSQQNLKTIHQYLSWFGNQLGGKGSFHLPQCCYLNRVFDLIAESIVLKSHGNYVVQWLPLPAFDMFSIKVCWLNTVLSQVANW